MIHGCPPLCICKIKRAFFFPAILDLEVVKTPTNVSPELSWSIATDAGTGVSQYIIYRSTTSGDLGSQIDTTANLTYTDASLGSNDDTYYYTVRAIDIAICDIATPLASGGVVPVPGEVHAVG